MRILPLFTRALALCGLALCLAACDPGKPLRVGTHSWVGYESLRLARDFGWLPPAVSLSVQTSAGNSLSALRTGTLDAAALTLDEVLQARAQGVPLTVVLVFDSSAGADVLLARPPISRLADLAGRRVAYEPTAVGSLVLREVLQRAGLTAESVTLVELTPPGQLAAWRSAQVDAVVTYEPTAAQLLREGAVQLFDSRQMPETIFDVLAVRSDRLAGRERVLRELLAAHFRVLNYIRQNRQDAAHRIAAYHGVSSDEVLRALGGIVQPWLAGNRYALTPGSRFDAAVQQLHALMIERRMLPRPDPLEGLFSADYLPLQEARGP